MANPWSHSIEDIALIPLRKFLDSEQRIMSVAQAEEKLNSDPTDIITKLRLADQKLMEHYKLNEKSSKNSLQPETIIVNNLAKDLATNLDIIYNYLVQYNDHDILKTALLDAIKQCNNYKVQITLVNRTKLIECFNAIKTLLPKVYKQAHLRGYADRFNKLKYKLENLGNLHEILQSDILGCVVECTLLLDDLHNCVKQVKSS